MMKEKTIKFFLLGVIYCLLLLGVYFVHINYFKVNVVFYAAIIDGLIATALLMAILYLRIFSCYTAFEKILIVFIGLIIGYTTAISVPTVIDRSLSFYILEKIDQCGGGIRQDKFHDVFVKEYMREHRLVDVRLTEQLESGTIYFDEGCVRLTPKGEKIVRFSRYFRQNWLPKRRLLMGEYTDDLTDPFREKHDLSEYMCVETECSGK